MFANVYSDTQHTAVQVLHEDLVALPRLHLMCGDFNIRHVSWDPNGPEVCVHADCLMAVCDALGLTLSSPVEEGPTHFPFNEALTPTVIDLMFVPAEVSLTMEHEIHPDLRGMSDHAPLTVTLPGPDSEVPVTRWSIQAGSDEEQAYLGEVLESLELLLTWEGQTVGEVDRVVEAISAAFLKAWESQAKETRRGKHSNGWWTQECSDSIAVYRASRDADDWADYRRVMHAAKRDFFEDRMNHVASINQCAWDLMAWMRKRNLPTYEAISYRGVPCNSLESLWEALDRSYNTAALTIRAQALTTLHGHISSTGVAPRGSHLCLHALLMRAYARVTGPSISRSPCRSSYRNRGSLRIPPPRRSGLLCF
jgi:hypothetical protein